MKYQLDLQKKYLLESAAQINGLNCSLAMLTSAATNNTGNEPSISVYHRALDEAHEVLAKTPAQSLASIKAQAIKDAVCATSQVIEGRHSQIHGCTELDLFSYASKIGGGE